MVKVTLAIGMLLGLIATSAHATKINFVNKCTTPVELYHSERFEKLEKLSDITPGASFARDISGTAHMFRHGLDTDATRTFPSSLFACLLDLLCIAAC